KEGFGEFSLEAMDDEEVALVDGVFDGAFGELCDESLEVEALVDVIENKMTTLAEHIIVAGTKNHPLMLENSMYDSWASRVRIFIKGKKHGRMMLDSFDNGPLVYPTVKENRRTRPMKYSKLTEAQQLQDDCDVQATNIILHGPPPDVLVVPMFQQGEDPIECINKAMAFLSAVESSFYHQTINLEHRLILEIKQPFKMTESQFNKFKEDKIRVMLEKGIWQDNVLRQKVKRNAPWFKEKLMLAEAQEADLDAYDSDCDHLSSAKAVLMANLLSCDPGVLSEVSYSDSYLNDTINKDVEEMQYSE
nr:hypothetical protein [Tanacetum cinerariifolium]